MPCRYNARERRARAATEPTMTQAESPKPLTEGLPAPSRPPRTPEMQARIDRFKREIGPAMVEALRKATTEPDPAPTPVPSFKHPPEMQARIDRFKREIVPAMIESLRKSTMEDRLTP